MLGASPLFAACDDPVGRCERPSTEEQKSPPKPNEGAQRLRGRSAPSSFELIEKRADTDLVREMLAFAAGRVMDLEVETLTGVPAGVRSPERLNQRNGYRERAWDTRAGRIDLAIPKLRKGS